MNGKSCRRQYKGVRNARKKSKAERRRWSKKSSSEAGGGVVLLFYLTYLPSLNWTARENLQARLSACRLWELPFVQGSPIVTGYLDFFLFLFSFFLMRQLRLRPRRPDGSYGKYPSAASY